MLLRCADSTAPAGGVSGLSSGWAYAMVLGCCFWATVVLGAPEDYKGEQISSHFDNEVSSKFMESTEVPVKSIRQRQTRGACLAVQHPAERDAICNAAGAKPQFNIRRVCATEQQPSGHCPPSNNLKPVMMMITAPDCGGCEHMKAAVNRGTAARALLEQFDVVHVHGPVVDWTVRWKEIGFEGTVPQTYFYSRDGRPLDIINTAFDPQFTHLKENSG